MFNHPLSFLQLMNKIRDKGRPVCLYWYHCLKSCFISKYGNITFLLAIVLLAWHADKSFMNIFISVKKLKEKHVHMCHEF